MKYRTDLILNKDYTQYVKEQNVVADYSADQTAKINYLHYDVTPDKVTSILDIGCRDGKFIKRFEPTYKDVYGIDIGENAMKRASKNFGSSWANTHIKITDIQDKNFVNPFPIKFDFINFSHVIEHLLDPVQALKNINSMMNKNAKILVIIPADIPRFKTLEECIKRQPYHEIFWENTDDVIHFFTSNNYNIIKLDEYEIGSTNGEWRVLIQQSN